MFWRQRDLFAIAVAIAWLSTSLFDVAVYAGDARTLVLPLVTSGGWVLWLMLDEGRRAPLEGIEVSSIE